MMRHSEQLNDLAKALSAAQGAMENASKGKVNPHFKSKYADLGSIWDAIREPLAKHGLSVVQLPFTDEAGQIRVSTLLMHSSGQWIEASYALPPTKGDAQGFGSAITYMKRYALTGMGVAPEDDDGEAAVRPAANGSAATLPINTTNGGYLSDEQIQSVKDLIKRVNADEPKFRKYMGIQAIRDIKSRDYEKAITALNHPKVSKAEETAQ